MISSKEINKLNNFAEFEETILTVAVTELLYK